MARQLTTRAQVNGYRFLLRRLDHALIRRDVRMLHDPMRSQGRALAVGAVLGVLVLAGFAVWGLVSPQGSVGKSTIVAAKTGGTYVVIDGTMHPVLNLASARLITGSDEKPASASEKKLARYPRGPLLGIPGAPSALPVSSVSAWTVCDSTDASAADGASGIGAGSVGARTGVLTVVAGEPELGADIRAANADDALYVTDGAGVFLIYQLDRDGHPTPVRAQVDTSSVPVLRALGLEGRTPRPISRGLLNTFPEVDPLTLPDIPGQGGVSSPADVGSPWAGGARVGSVIKTSAANGVVEYYVVLRGGVQPISAAAAEILRLAERDDAAPVATVAPGVVASTPMRDELPIADFPTTTPHLVTPSEGTVCRAWVRGADADAARTTLLVGDSLPLPDGSKPVRVASADGSGPGVDQVYVRPGSGAYVQVTGNESDSARAESRFYVADTGVRYGVPDAKTGSVLRLGASPTPAPWDVISLLVAGPTLSRENALVAHDGMGADPAGIAVNPPESAQQTGG